MGAAKRDLQKCRGERSSKHVWYALLDEKRVEGGRWFLPSFPFPSLPFSSSCPGAPALNARVSLLLPLSLLPLSLPFTFIRQARGVELVESDWDFSALITKQLGEWVLYGGVETMVFVA